MAKQKNTQKKDHLEKTLRYVLGVAPDEFGLCPNPDGYIPLKELIMALRDDPDWRGLSEGRILELSNLPLNQSILEIKDKSIRILPELSELPPSISPELKPPKLLYFGLKPSAWPAVFKYGLGPKPGESHLKLFPTKEMALKVAQRFCQNPFIITVTLALTVKDGTVINPYSENLWLSGQLKPEALSGPPISFELENEKSKKAHQQKDKPKPLEQKIPGQKTITIEPVIHHGKKKGKYSDSPDWKTTTRKERRKVQHEMEKEE
jgi:putative RNA 2'-phosphotransferase